MFTVRVVDPQGYTEFEKAGIVLRRAAVELAEKCKTGARVRGTFVKVESSEGSVSYSCVYSPFRGRRTTHMESLL